MSISENIRNQRRERYQQEEAEALEKQGDMAQMKRLMKYLWPRRHQVFFAIFLCITIAVLVPAPMVLIKYGIDWYILPGNYAGLIGLVGVLVALNMLLFAIEQYSQYLIAKIGQFSMRDMRVEIFTHLQAMPLRFFDRNPVGRLITRITSDVNVLNELFSQGVVGIFQQIFSLVAIFCVLLWYNWQLTLWILPTIPLMLIASYNFRNQVYIAFRLTRVRLSRLNTFMQENVTGMRTVQANTREGIQFNLFDELNAAHRDAHLKTVFQYSLFFPLIEVISALGLAIVLYKGGMMFLNLDHSQAVTLGQLGLFVQALERFFTPIKDLSEKYNIVQSAIAASERLFALLDTKPTVDDPEIATPVGPLATGIEFRDVWFAYNDEEWVLKGVSFRVEKGQTIAVVGPTGSGKTTLMSLLCRFYDVQRGSILIDGVDIREMRQADLRAKLAIVMQDVFLFNGSIQENVQLGNPEISPEDVVNVCRETGFHRFVEEMPQQYLTGVRERGATLSTGQKQLLSFSRALAYDPEILILDEATANVDTESELQLQRAVARLCEGRTSIVIAHRLSTIQRADKILVIHHGHLAESGSHQELLAKGGLYRKLYDLQYREQSAEV